MKVGNDLKFGSVIVTFNRKKLLLESIDSLLSQAVSPEVIIIVDNNSTDGTQSLLELKGYLKNAKLKYYHLNKNIGGAGGFAFGLKQIVKYDVDWVTISDDDAIYEKDFLQNISHAQKKYPEVKAFTGTVKLIDGRIQYTHRRRVTNWNRIKDIDVPLKDYPADFDLDIFSFVGAVLSVSLIKKIGFPESDYFIWWDDIEYSLRVRKYSKIVNVHNATIVHKAKVISIDYNKNYRRDWREYYGWRNRIVTIRKHAKSKVLANLYLIIWMLKQFIFINKSFYKGQRRHVFKVYWRAYRDAYLHHMGLNKHYLPGSNE